MPHRTSTLLALVLALLMGRQLRADAVDDEDFSRMMNPSGRLVILGSGHDYAALLHEARVIGRKSGIRVWLMGRSYDSREGWTSADEGDGVGGYFLRNAIDGGDKAFISIERSDAYPGLQKGHFIIVGGVFLSAPEAAASLAQFRKSVPGAYTPRATIYMGCRH